MAVAEIDIAALVASLDDLRLPAEAAWGLSAVLLAAFGLGLVVAVLVTSVLRGRVLAVGTPAARRSFSRSLQEARRQSGEARRLALLRLLRDTRPNAFARLQPGLYQKEGLPGSATLEALLVAPSRRPDVES